MNKALIVEDVEMNREILCDILDDEYEVIEASNGEEALRLIAENSEDLSIVFLDLMMPVLDGFGVLEAMKQNGWLDRYPVLVITSDTESGTELRCLEYGVADFITKPFKQHLVKRRAANATQLYNYKKDLEKEVEDKTAEIIAKNNELAEMNDNILQLLGDVVEARNQESGEHVKRVKQFVNILGRYIKNNYPEYGLTDEDVALITRTSPMHDIGKIMIPDAILMKPGKLTDEEREEMNKHTVYGCEVLERTKYLWPESYSRTCYDICRYHHERVDGRGYPEGLKDDEIPISAQIVGVADVYDALTTDRVYKKAFDAETAYNMIEQGQCGKFSDKMMEALTQCFPEMRMISDNK